MALYVTAVDENSPAKRFGLTVGCALLAIDGRCGSGKSTLAAHMAQVFGCPVFHMDDFFLPPAARHRAGGKHRGGMRREEALRRPLSLSDPRRGHRNPLGGLQRNPD